MYSNLESDFIKSVIHNKKEDIKSILSKITDLQTFNINKNLLHFNRFMREIFGIVVVYLYL